MPDIRQSPRRPEPGIDDEVDVVVVGGGPAGLAAASWVARYRRSVLLVDSGEHRADPVEASHGYLGRDPQRPRDLLDRGRSELLAYPTAAICDGRVRSISHRRDGLFDVRMASDVSIAAHRIVLACGVTDSFPEVRGFAEHYGASAFHCPSCDGYEARGRDVVCIGWDEQITGFATELLGWAESVTVVTDGRDFNGDGAAREVLRRHGVPVVHAAADELLGRRGALTGVRLHNGRVLPAALLFFSIAHHPRNDLAAALGCELDESGHVVVNDCGMSSRSNVYACGDLVPGLQLTSVAAATGVVAGVGAAESLRGARGARTSPEPAPDAEAELASMR